MWDERAKGFFTGGGGDTFPTVKPSDRVYQRPYKRFYMPFELKRVSIYIYGQWWLGQSTALP